MESCLNFARALLKPPQQGSHLVRAQQLFCHRRAVIIACNDILRSRTSKKIAFAWWMHLTWVESGESMSYFSPGSPDKSTASTHTHIGLSSTAAAEAVCASVAGAESQTSHKWLPWVYHNCTATQGAAETESWSCILSNPLEHLCPRSPMRHCLVEQGKRQTGVGLQGWKFREQWQQSTSQLLTCLLRKQPTKGQQTRKAHLPTATSRRLKEHKAKPENDCIYGKGFGECMSFPWLTTIISCKVFVCPEITAL